MQTISQPLKERIRKAQQDWGEGLVQISQHYTMGGLARARKTASKLIDDLYCYADMQVLFKPTMASGDQTFRLTKQGAISYFVGHDPDYSQDTGFALRGWRRFEIEEAGAFVSGTICIWMGRIILEDEKGEITRVDKSWGYKEDPMGFPRIVLHHSSLPFEPEAIR